MKNLLKLLGVILISTTLLTSCVTTNRGYNSSPVISRNVQLDPIKADIVVSERAKLSGEGSATYFLFFRVGGDRT